jgi:hypothetical protein
MIAQEAAWFANGYPYKTARGEELDEIMRFEIRRLNRASDGFRTTAIFPPSPVSRGTPELRST